MSFLGINASEFLILVVLAVIFFGPERIPEFSRKAARVVFYVRNIANGATQQLRDELGPEYQDLTLEDLNPKTFVQKHLLDEIQADLDDVRSDLDDVRREVGSAASAATSATDTANRAVRESGAAGTAPASADSAPTEARPPAAAAAALDSAVSVMRARYGLCFDLDAT